jgi:nicotinate-nucleotide pyrophosphorylase (carboxylating)
MGYGDVTGGCLDPDLMVGWFIEAQGDGVACGVGVADFLLGPQAGDPENASIDVFVGDGEEVQRGTRIMEGVALARRLVAAERTALNFMMHLSGVATLTRQFVQRVEGTHAKITDTRKTIPGMRVMQKYAVRCGGGHNHRMGLYDAALIKDNHIQAAGGIREAVTKLRSYASHMTKLEVECESMEQVREAVEAGADVVLLDNMDPFMMREAVKKYRDRCVFEASGSISLDTVRGVAQTGVDIISVGLLTHSAPAVPYHLEVR